MLYTLHQWLSNTVSAQHSGCRHNLHGEVLRVVRSPSRRRRRSTHQFLALCTLHIHWCYMEIRLPACGHAASTSPPNVAVYVHTLVHGCPKIHDRWTSFSTFSIVGRSYKSRPNITACVHLPQLTPWFVCWCCMYCRLESNSPCRL